MKNLNNTITTLLTNENGFIRPYFNFRSNVNDLIEWGKDSLKSEWDLEWDNDDELESIVNEMMGQISTKEELNIFDEMMLEFGSLFTHLKHEEDNDEVQHVSTFFMKKKGDSYQNIRAFTTANKETYLYSNLKMLYKNEDTIVDVQLQSKVVHSILSETVDYFLNVMVNQMDDMSSSDVYSYNKLVMVHATSLYNIESNKENKKALMKFVKQISKQSKKLEQCIISDKVNDLLV